LYTATQIQRAIPERIDRLPLSREMWRILFLAGIAWLIESYDVGIIGSVLPLLSKQYHLTSVTTGLVSTASTLGIVVAVIPSGLLADQIGRKQVLMIGTAFYAIFSFLCGFAPNMPVFIVLRFIAGLGMGAVFPIPYAMAAEMISKRFRGATAAILDSFLSFGYFLAPLLAFFVNAHASADMSWRILLFVGGIPLLYVPFIMKWMPESPRWLQSKGRLDEANRVLQNLETVIEKRTGTPLPEPQIELNMDVVTTKISPLAIFHRGYLKRTLMMWISFACILFIFYAIQTYTPTVLVKQGNGIGDAFLLTTIIVIASVPGKYVAGFVLERMGRKFTLVSFTLIAAVAAVLFGLAHNEGLALFFGCIMSFFGIGVDPAIKIYGAEQYPTSIRETGVSTIEAIGRLFGGALAPFIMAFTLANVGVPGSYVFVAVLAVIGVLVVFLLGTETRGQVLEKAATIVPAKLTK